VKKTKQQLDQQRREFIKKTTLVGVGVATASVLPGTVGANVTEQEPDTRQKGYRVTQHVIDYYKSAAI